MQEGVDLENSLLRITPETEIGTNVDVDERKLLEWILPPNELVQDDAEPLEWTLPSSESDKKVEQTIEQTVESRFDIRLQKIQELTDSLSKSHHECSSALCRHGILRCETGFRLNHWQEIFEGCKKAKEIMSPEDRTILELLWEKLERWDIPPDPSTQKLLGQLVGTEKISEEQKTNQRALHYLVVGLRAYIAGDTKNGRIWAVRGGLELPLGYVYPEEQSVNRTPIQPPIPRVGTPRIL